MSILKRIAKAALFLLLMLVLTTVFHIVFVEPVDAWKRAIAEADRAVFVDAFPAGKPLLLKKAIAEADRAVFVDAPANIEGAMWDYLCFAVLCVVGVVIVYLRGIRRAAGLSREAASDRKRSPGPPAIRDREHALPQHESTTQPVVLDSPPLSVVCCAHCGTRVIRNADGQCPACRQFVQE